MNTKTLTLKRKNTHIQAEVELPGSKSESNRALMMAAYGDFQLRAAGLSDAADTRLMQRNLDLIEDCRQSGVSCVIDCENAGTVLRFLLPYLAGLPGKWMLTGSLRMMERPVAPLVEALQRLGAVIQYTDKTGYPPLLIQGKQLQGGTVEVDGSKSSQFVSALLMAGPSMENGLRLIATGKLVSSSYFRMTVAMMQRLGISITEDDNGFTLKPCAYQPKPVLISRDWSGAAFWYELMALADGGELWIKDLSLQSLQGDRVLAELFQKLGVETVEEEDGLRIIKKEKVVRELKFDFTDCPDLFPAVAACCAGLQLKAVFTGLAHLRIKETDRIHAMTTELAKVGCVLKPIDDDVYATEYKNIASPSNPRFMTYGDHRVAMALAPLVMKTASAIINDPQVVQKSYPEFWEMLMRTGAFTIAYEGQ